MSNNIEHRPFWEYDGRPYNTSPIMFDLKRQVGETEEQLRERLSVKIQTGNFANRESEDSFNARINHTQEHNWLLLLGFRTRHFLIRMAAIDYHISRLKEFPSKHLREYYERIKKDAI